MRKGIRQIELLAPARNAATAIEAVKHGADAVYMGASAFGARAAAGNSIEDITAVVDFAHRFNARVYSTVNTIIYDNELKDAERLIKSLYKAGVDALIVQDLGILRLDIPPIELHASTQCDIRTAEKAKFLESLGFSQLVMARELSLHEISEIYNTVNVPLESFVHGALCVSYSGRCEVSEVLKGRSANRGECAQICRLPFDLVDENGNKIVANKHLLSLRDLNQSERIEQMIEAGVSSFKIEGRLKDIGYVKNVVSYYRRKLDSFLLHNSDKYKRSSIGTSEYTFTPDLRKSFNRSFTHYFLDSRNLENGIRIASIDTPKSQGEPIGTVKYCRNNKVGVEATKVKINNGDGMSFFATNGEYCGFRANKVVNNEIETFNPITIRRGTMLYRTLDNAFENIMQSDSAERCIKLSAELNYKNEYLYLSLRDERGSYISCSTYIGAVERAKNSQKERQISVLQKLGNTIYRLENASVLEDLFIPSSILTQLRREAIGKLDSAHLVNYKYNYRRAEDLSSKCFSDRITYADNVANHLAQEVYKSHGAVAIEKAIELDNSGMEYKSVMHTRYCLRREFGACRKSKTASKKLPDKLFLRYGNDTTLEIVCDCKSCEMKLYVRK